MRRGWVKGAFRPLLAWRPIHPREYFGKVKQAGGRDLAHLGLLACWGRR